MKEKLKITICTGTTCYIMGGAQLLSIKEFLPEEIRENIIREGSPCLEYCKNQSYKAKNDEFIDYVLTFEELAVLFAANNIKIQDCEIDTSDINGKKYGAGFPVIGGVSNAVKYALDKNSGNDNYNFNPVFIDWITKQSIRLLKFYQKRNCLGNFV